MRFPFLDLHHTMSLNAHDRDRSPHRSSRGEKHIPTELYRSTTRSSTGSCVEDDIPTNPLIIDEPDIADVAANITYPSTPPVNYSSFKTYTGEQVKPPTELCDVERNGTHRWVREQSNHTNQQNPHLNTDQPVCDLGLQAERPPSRRHAESTTTLIKIIYRSSTKLNEVAQYDQAGGRKSLFLTKYKFRVLLGMMFSMPISNSVEDMIHFDNHDPNLTLPTLVRHIGGGVHITIADRGVVELSAYECIGGIFQRVGDAVGIPLTGMVLNAK